MKRNFSITKQNILAYVWFKVGRGFLYSGFVADVVAERIETLMFDSGRIKENIRIKLEDK